MAQCTSCGRELDCRDRLCSSCGAITERGRSIAERLGRSVGRLVDRIARYMGNPENRGQVVTLGAIAALMLLVATDNPLSKAILGPSDRVPDLPQFKADGSPDFENYKDIFHTEEAQYIVTGKANVRNYPTSQDTLIIDTLRDGEIVTVRQVQPFDGTTTWYKLSGGGYIWAGNLAYLDDSSGEDARTFPRDLRGRWSSMDTCRGQDLNATVDITSDRIEFYEAYGRLKRISHDYKDRELYHLAMSGEGQTWEATYRIMLTGDGMTLVLFDIGDPNQPNQVYHNPQGGCGRVSFGG